MNLSYSAEYEQFRAEVRRFLDEHWTAEDRANAPSMMPGMGPSPVISATTSAAPPSASRRSSAAISTVTCRGSTAAPSSPPIR